MESLDSVVLVVLLLFLLPLVLVAGLIGGLFLGFVYAAFG
jgi:uncharacterized protein YneF (UPF0154 family)